MRAAALETGQYGPPVTGGRRRRPGRLNWRAIALTLVAFVALCSITATATAGALLWYGNRAVRRLPDIAGIKDPGDTDGDGKVDFQGIADVRNVLLVGSDSRAGLSGKERSKLGTGAFEGVRTDTIILLQLDPDRRAAAMLSFPRDLLVTRCDGTQGRINGAFEIGRTTRVGGPSCLVQTIDRLTGIPINHYVQVDFEGFVDVVDTLGGVRMYLREPISDEDANIDLPAGCQTLNGREALGFVRVRKIDNDFGRIARQQRFIREVVEQVTSTSVALNLPRLFALVDAAARAVETDKSLSLGVMRRIAFSFRDLSADRIDARTVPGFNRTIAGAAYVVADEIPAQALFAAFRAGVAAPAEVGKQGPSDVTVADVPPLTVLNGTTTPGLAAEAAELLRGRGYTVVATDNAEDQSTRRTAVVYAGQRREEARLVARVFPGARITRGAASTALTVVLGRDVDLDKLAARAQGLPTQAPSPAPTPTFKGVAGVNRDC